MNNLHTILCGLITFFQKIGFELNIASEYKNLIFEGKNEILNSEGHVVDDDFILPNLIIDEPIFTLIGRNNFENIRFLIFGAAKSKPDIILNDVLDGNLKVLNDKDVLVYDDDIKESLTYADFKIWWNKNDYYKKNFNDDMFPVLIPQVYLHYDPKDKETRKKYKYNNNLIFQRMDFLIIYKNRRVIIEIDGKTHTPENSLEQYSKQLEYDRTMKFLGYDIFRLGGYELTHNFEETIKMFFDNLMLYLKISKETDSK